MGVHFAEALEAGDIYLGVRIIAAELGGVLIALLVRESKSRRLAARQLKKRRHRGVDIAIFDERAHIAEEERQQQRPDVRAVDIGIRHDDDLVVTELIDVEILAKAGAERDDDGLELIVAVNFVGSHLFDVQHLAPQRQDRLEARVAPLRGAAACRVALYDVELGELGVIFVAVAQLVGHRRAAEGALAADGLACLARGLSRAVGRHGLIEDRARHDGVFLKELHQPVGNKVVDQRSDLAVAELCLRLALELRVRQLDGDHARQSLAAVLAAHLVALFDNAVFDAVGVQNARERGLEAGLVHTALGRVDVVGERENIFLIAVVILKREFRERVALHTAHVDDVIVQRLLFLVEPRDEFADTALVAHRVAALALGLFLALNALILDRDAKARVQKRLLTHAGVQGFVGVFQLLEHLGVGLEGDSRARVVGRADDRHLLRDLAAGEFHLVDAAVFVDLHRQPFGQRVDDARADAVQTAGNFVSAAAELAARVQHGIDDLERGTARLRLNVDRNAAAVIHNSDGVALVDRHLNFRAVARERFVDGVIHNFVDEVMQAAHRRRADVHARALAHRLQPLEHLDL